MGGVVIADRLTAMGACSEAVTWARAYGTDYERAWLECTQADWMLWLYVQLPGADRRRLVLAACACAETALVYVPAGEDRPRAAIETARAWARGEATIEQVRAASFAAAAYAASAAAARGAAWAASDAAWAAAAAAYADAAWAAWAASATAWAADVGAELATMAPLVRAEIPWPAVQAAMETPP